MSKKKKEEPIDLSKIELSKRNIEEFRQIWMEPKRDKELQESIDELNNLKIIAENTVEEPYLECDRCEISSETEGRMIPCPRGGCEAKVVGVKKTHTVIERNFKED